MPPKLTIEQAKKNIYDKYGDDFEILDDVYVSMHTKMNVKHNICGAIYPKSYAALYSRGSCAACCGTKIITGINDLWTKRPDIAALLEDGNIGYKLGVGSNQKVNFVCPTCNSINPIIVGNVCKNGLFCHFCNDVSSLPEKFMRNLLKQLNIPFIEEYDPEWIRPKRYDFYIPTLDLIIEMDGGLGHGKRVFSDKTKVDEEGKTRDILKDKKAFQHGLTVIRIDCDYQHNDACKYIQSNIITSKLSDLLDLTNVDWDQVVTQAQRNEFLDIINAFNNNVEIIDLSNIYNINSNTIRNYLKKGHELGLVDAELFKLKYNTHNAAVCQYDLEGYQWRYYVGNYERIESVRQHGTKKVEQYTLTGEYIESFLSIKEAAESTNTRASCITLCCKNIYQHAGGYIWRYAQN